MVEFGDEICLLFSILVLQTEEEFEYASAPVQQNLANSFSNIPGENRVDKLENKANILTLPRSKFHNLLIIFTICKFLYR